jgi:hypothetical protein
VEDFDFRCKLHTLIVELMFYYVNILKGVRVSSVV